MSYGTVGLLYDVTYRKSSPPVVWELVKWQTSYVIMIRNMVLRDLEVQYWEVRKSTPFDFVWKNIFPLTKKKSMDRDIFK